MKVKVESEKVGLKFNIQKTKIMASGAITSWQIDGETVETVSDFILGLEVFPGLQQETLGSLDLSRRGLCRGAAGNPRVPRLLPGTLGNFPGPSICHEVMGPDAMILVF